MWSKSFFPKLSVSTLAIFALICASHAQNVQPRFRVCHGYDCHYRTMVTLTAADQAKIRRLFSTTADAAGERKAIRKSVAIFEERSTQVIGVRDEPKMAFGRPNRKGQMDCIDESTNTDAFLHYLKANSLLRYHDVSRLDSRGFFIDGRYPHWTAVIVDRQKQKWAVDSWYEAGGGEPDIMPLKDWKKRGRGGSR